jgi:hypothetical protein
MDHTDTQPNRGIPPSRPDGDAGLELIHHMYRLLFRVLRQLVI